MYGRFIIVPFRKAVLQVAIRWAGDRGRELKQLILEENKLEGDELIITNDQTKEVYAENTTVPQNTRIIVKRIPASRSISTVAAPSATSAKTLAATLSSKTTSERAGSSNGDDDEFGDEIKMAPAPEPEQRPTAKASTDDEGLAALQKVHYDAFRSVNERMAGGRGRGNFRHTGFVAGPSSGGLGGGGLVFSGGVKVNHRRSTISVIGVETAVII